MHLNTCIKVDKRENGGQLGAMRFSIDERLHDRISHVLQGSQPIRHADLVVQFPSVELVGIQTSQVER